MDARDDEESSKSTRRSALRILNQQSHEDQDKPSDSSLKRHTAFIKRMKQSLAADNRDQIIKDIDSLSLEKYIDEIVAATVDGITRCKTDKDVWSAVEIISALHRRFPKTYTIPLISLLQAALAPPPRNTANVLSAELKEKEDLTRIARQRPVLRVCSELALVHVICDSPGHSGGEWIMKALKDLLSGDPSLSALPLLTTFLKSFLQPFLGLSPANYVIGQEDKLQDTVTSEPQGSEFVETEIKNRFRKMCQGYFEKVSSKLVSEYRRLQEQDKRNHEAYVRSGEIFEDRQQAYEKMTKNYEKLFAGCQSLSELLHISMPELHSIQQQQQQTIGVSTTVSGQQFAQDVLFVTGGPWEDEEERRFYEDIPDLADFVPKAMLGIPDGAVESEDNIDPSKKALKRDTEPENDLLTQLNEEIADLSRRSTSQADSKTPPPPDTHGQESLNDHDPSEEALSRPATPLAEVETVPGAGPSQLLTALLTRLPDATNRTLVDELAVEFAYMNSKAARKRLVKHLSQLPKSRTDLIPYYARLTAILNKHLPDIGEELVSMLEEEFRYLNRKRTVKELAESRMRNIAYISALSKFKVVPSHSILHMFKVYLDDFTGTNVENVALMLEGCGRFLLRNEDTRERMSAMIELMKRKQSLQHFDQRQLLLLENAYYQCNPPERRQREEKERSEEELFLRYLLQDTLSRKTIDKVLRLLRKFDWNNSETSRLLHKYCSRPWKIKHSNISLLAMLIYDLQRYHPDFVIGVVDQVLENIRRGLEHNVYTDNQRRIATMKYLGELYIYRVVGSSIIFDTLWSLASFGHLDGRPYLGHFCSIDSPDDFFRVRLVCILLDTCGMCFDRGTQKRKLDQFLVFFQAYVLSKDPMPMDVEFMYLDSMEAVRPKLELCKTLEDAITAVEELFSAVQGDDREDEDSVEESDGEGRRNVQEDDEEDDEEEDDQRASTPDALVLRPSKDDLGPSEVADADFAKELAKMITESSHDSRKVDKRTALALWDSAVPPAGIKKKKGDDNEELTEETENPKFDSMKFTVITRRGHKQQNRQLEVPADSDFVVQTRSAQMQDKAEQEQLKKLVLDYEQREEAAFRNANGYRV